MNRFIWKLILATTILLAPNAFASGGGPSLVGFLTYRADGVAFFYINGTRTGTKPACATFGSGSWFRFAIDTNTAGGKAQLAGVLAAHATGESIYVTGTGDCGVYGDTESVLELHAAS
jgi:purine nucleoside permease